ncbi:hypothetical protein BVRB_6g142680 [Beta vulgaris subsp. vulgaris]|uniref:Uncharacterized protein n=1 Tax=Beta vulgaris subsp. vulgaris TaxID=3555 RepID=A0A0J8C7I3_BETVV|nr:hypothetical protein BVRB_6g142680 [Beta vulgaris subsp. vulgaris]
MADNQNQNTTLPNFVDEEGNVKLNFGFVILKKITNSSSNSVHFLNPFFPTNTGYTEGDIEPGVTEDKLCYGNIPYYSAPQKYEVRYYNRTLEEECVIYIKDLGGDWLVSFQQGDSVEHITDILPGARILSSAFQLFINNNGFELIQLGVDGLTPACRKGGLSFW